MSTLSAPLSLKGAPRTLLQMSSELFVGWLHDHAGVKKGKSDRCNARRNQRGGLRKLVLRNPLGALGCAGWTSADGARTIDSGVPIALIRTSTPLRATLIAPRRFDALAMVAGCRDDIVRSYADAEFTDACGPMLIDALCLASLGQ